MLYAGETVLITAEIRIGGVLADPDTMKIEIRKDSKTGDVVQSETNMTKTDTGKYEYAWDSDGQSAGDFWAKVKATKDALPNWEWTRIKLN